MDSRALEFVAPHCDVEERIGALPQDAKVRGVAFTTIVSALKQADKLALYCERFGPLHYESLAQYPLADYLIGLASAAALLRSVDQVYQGIAEISRMNARALTASLLGQTLIHALASDPLSLLEQGLAMRRQIFLTGHWELRHNGPRDVEVHYEQEYVWIEAAHHNAALGTFESCNVKPNVTTVLSSPYSGFTRFQW